MLLPYYQLCLLLKPASRFIVGQLDLKWAGLVHNRKYLVAHFNPLGLLMSNYYIPYLTVAPVDVHMQYCTLFTLFPWQL